MCHLIKVSSPTQLTDLAKFSILLITKGRLAKDMGQQSLSGLIWIIQRRGKGGGGYKCENHREIIFHD